MKAIPTRSVGAETAPSYPDERHNAALVTFFESEMNDLLDF